MSRPRYDCTDAVEREMKSKTVGLLLMTLLAAACGRQQTSSDGNGPGNADGVGGREDPPTAPASEPGQSTQPSEQPRD